MKCTICNENDVKYRCPRCETRTCSLPCVKQHKVMDNCSGQRDKTAFVAVNDMTDLNLLNDYRFLEEAGRKTDNAIRDIKNKKKNKTKGVCQLCKEARRRGVNLQLMTFPMSKRRCNTTFFNYKLKKFFWKIEWIFTECEEKFCDRKVPDDETIENILSKHLHSTDSGSILWHKLEKYVSHWPDGIQLFLELSRRSVKCKKYRELSLSDTLANNLYGTTILEHPTIFVCTSESATKYWSSCEERKSRDKCNQPETVQPHINHPEKSSACGTIGFSTNSLDISGGIHMETEMASVQNETECAKENEHITDMASVKIERNVKSIE